MAAYTVAGREPNCTVRLAAQEASSHHAALFWTGERWEARDLGSTNGTIVDETRVQSRENAPLARGAILRFGCDDERWELIDDRGPVVLARSVATDEVRAAEDGLLALPGPDNVLLTVLVDSEDRWLIETADGSRRPARDREQVTVAGETWELTVPPDSPVAGTFKAKPSPTLATLTLRFHVSKDEEHVRVEVLDGDDVLPLGERVGFYPLLLLARERRKDASDPMLPEGEQGWRHVVDLANDLVTDEGAVNVTIHRLRKVFAKAGVVGADRIVERRHREIRIGTGRLEERRA